MTLRGRASRPRCTWLQQPWTRFRRRSIYPGSRIACRAGRVRAGRAARHESRKRQLWRREPGAVAGDLACEVRPRRPGDDVHGARLYLLADRIANHADFFSFGTNDLTQAGIGFSRDDIEGRIIPRYVEEKIVDGSPFATIDQAGVGEIVRIAVQRGRRARPDLELGICGEHGGDPASIRFFHDAGLDYVSCSPFRLPIARVAAAQAAIEAPRKAPAR
jgi:PEP-utilising enzyme, PEP-binding domain